MKLYTIYSDRLALLRERFRTTLRDDYEIVEHRLDKEAEGTRGGGSETWCFKIKDIICAIKENLGSTIIYSDIDIQFFKPTKPTVLEYIKDHDIVFQRNDTTDEANIGFMAIRCNEITLNFWQKVLQRVVETKDWDQKVVNQLLKESYPLRWRLFPTSIWCWSQRSNWENIILHHANCPRTLKGKIDQMNFVAFTLKYRLVISLIRIITFLRSYPPLWRLTKIIFPRDPISGSFFKCL